MHLHHLPPDQLIQQVAPLAIQGVAPFARTRTTTTDRQTSLLVESDRHVFGVLREACLRVRFLRTPRLRGIFARRIVGGSGTLCRIGRKSPGGRRCWAHNLWGSRSRQESPYPLWRSAQARYGPQGSARSAGGSARDERIGRWGGWREWRTRSRIETLITCVDEMTCATPLTRAVQCESMTTRTRVTKKTAHSRVSVHVRCV